MKYKFEPLNVVNNRFYFGIGGIGDFFFFFTDVNILR